MNHRLNTEKEIRFPSLYYVCLAVRMMLNTATTLSTLSLLVLISATHVASAANLTLPLSAANVHWGYFSKTLTPVLTVNSGAEVEVEMATHHGCDDWDLMIEGDEGEWILWVVFVFGSGSSALATRVV
jgi:hypothetical protein